MSVWTVILIIAVIAAIILGVLYFVGRKMQAKQEDQRAQLDQMAPPGLGGGGLFPPQAAGGSAGAEAHHRRGGPRRRSYPIWTGQRPAGKHLAAPDRGVPCGGGPGSGGGGLHRGGPGADGAGVPVPEAVSAPVAGAALRPAGPEYLCEPSKSA